MSDSRYWIWSGCAEYACALHELNPALRFGRHVEYDEPDEDGFIGWYTNHVFVHDDSHAYDSLGKHPLPYNDGEYDTEYDVPREDIMDEWSIDASRVSEAHMHIDGEESIR